MELRSLLQQRLLRGKVDLSIALERPGGTDLQELNSEQVRHYVRSLQALSEQLGLSDAGVLPAVLQLPGVASPTQAPDAGQLWEQASAALERALERCEAFRVREGQALTADLQERLDGIRAEAEAVEALGAGRLQRTRQRLEQALADSLGPSRVDENRFEQELVYYLEKLDFNEELVRLRSHLDYFASSMTAVAGEHGKKLGFIAQEMGREINTLGSKANDAAIQQHVVRMKEELEKIKEQALNAL
jgi:uncharacterized protein (TIGR00255 family)